MAASSNSSSSSPPDTAPQIRPMPVRLPSAYHSMIWRRLGRCCWYCFQVPMGALEPSCRGGTTHSPAVCAAIATAPTFAAITRHHRPRHSASDAGHKRGIAGRRNAALVPAASQRPRCRRRCKYRPGPPACATADHRWQSGRRRPRQWAETDHARFRASGSARHRHDTAPAR